MKITIYTTPTCQFSQKEKEYLTSHTLAFEEKNLEANKEFLTEMMAVGNDFAGTPVTKIEKDDGTITVFKGFTKEEFDTALGFEEKPAQTEPTASEPQEVKTDATVPPVAESATVVPETPEVPNPVQPEAPMEGVLNQLENKMDEPKPAETPKADPPSPEVPADPPTPVVPAEPAKDSPPAIPDFPVDATQPAK